MIIWLTGNSGAGKTTIANLLEKNRPARVVVLDGDEMRGSISIGAGFTPAERSLHCLRVAMLARVLETRGHLVVVAVIAPFKVLRGRIDDLCSPVWVYVDRTLPADPEKPYEPPEDPALVVDNDRTRPGEAVRMIWELVEEMER